MKKRISKGLGIILDIMNILETVTVREYYYHGGWGEGEDSETWNGGRGG